MDNFWYKKALLLLLSMLIFSGCTLLNKKNVAGLQVITNNTTSSLFLDGQYLDKSPFIGKTIKPGEYTLKIVPDNQELSSYETQVKLNKGLLTVVTWKPGNRPETSGGVIYELEPSNTNQASVVFITIPDKAIIKLDDQEEQFSPITVNDVDPGHHQFEITLPSYEKQNHTINVLAKQKTTITVKLAKAVQPVEIKPSSNIATQSSNLTTNDQTDFNSTNNSSAASQSAIDVPYIKIEKTGFYYQNKETLRVRTSPSLESQTVGYTITGNNYPYLNETQDGWYKITFEDKTGWVSSDYSKLVQ